jgi:uncharacterized membrane protein
VSASLRPPGIRTDVERAAIDRAAVRMTLVLRLGLAAALALIAGAVALLAVEAAGAPESRVLSARTLTGYLGGAGLLAGLAQGRPEAVLTLGIYVLVATPVVRVATGVYYFRLSGDRPLARLAGAVLALLLASIFVIGPLVR